MLTDIGIDPSTEISEKWRDSKDIRQHCTYKIQSGFFEEAEKVKESKKKNRWANRPKKYIATTIKND
jgi:hypothetical protein